MSIIKLAAVVYLLFGLAILFGWWLSGAPFERGPAAAFWFAFWAVFWAPISIAAVVEGCAEDGP